MSNQKKIAKTLWVRKMFIYCYIDFMHLVVVVWTPFMERHWSGLYVGLDRHFETPPTDMATLRFSKRIFMTFKAIFSQLQLEVLFALIFLLIYSVIRFLIFRRKITYAEFEKWFFILASITLTILVIYLI